MSKEPKGSGDNTRGTASGRGRGRGRGSGKRQSSRNQTSGGSLAVLQDRVEVLESSFNELKDLLLKVLGGLVPTQPQVPQIPARQSVPVETGTQGEGKGSERPGRGCGSRKNMRTHVKEARRGLTKVLESKSSTDDEVLKAYCGFRGRLAVLVSTRKVQQTADEDNQKSLWEPLWGQVLRRVPGIAEDSYEDIVLNKPYSTKIERTEP